jgi:hypothetical protein
MKLYVHFLKDFELQKIKTKLPTVKNQDGGKRAFFNLKFPK